MQSLDRAHPTEPPVERAVALAFVLVAAPPATVLARNVVLHFTPDWVGTTPDLLFSTVWLQILGLPSAVVAGGLVGLSVRSTRRAAGASALGVVLGCVVLVASLLVDVGLRDRHVSYAEALSMLTETDAIVRLGLNAGGVVVTAVVAAVATATLLGPIGLAERAQDGDERDHVAE